MFKFIEILSPNITSNLVKAVVDMNINLLNINSLFYALSAWLPIFLFEFKRLIVCCAKVVSEYFNFTYNVSGYVVDYHLVTSGFGAVIIVEITDSYNYIQHII